MFFIKYIPTFDTIHVTAALVANGNPFFFILVLVCKFRQCLFHSCADRVTVAWWNEWAERQNMCLLFVWVLIQWHRFHLFILFISAPLENNVCANIRVHVQCRWIVCVFCVGVSSYGIVFSFVSELVGQFWPRSLHLYPEICWC